MRDYYSVTNLGYSWARYTWSKMCKNGQFVQQIQDRIVAALDCVIKFPDAKVLHLLWIKSDHYPLFLSLTVKKLEDSNRPFRLKTKWLEHLEFKNMVAQTWYSALNNHQHAISIFLIRARSGTISFLTKFLLGKKKLSFRWPKKTFVLILILIFLSVNVL